MLRTYRWSSLVDPSQVDVAQVNLLSKGVRASGTQTTGAYTAQWELDASRAWTTTWLVVEVRGYGGWGRRLDLRRAPDLGEWSASTTETGTPPDGLVPPGLAEGVDLSGTATSGSVR